jgi:hypothetical protein
VRGGCGVMGVPAPGYGVCSFKKVGVYKDHRCKVLLILLEYCKELVDCTDGSP